MNIQIQSCGFIILCLCAYFYLQYPKIWIKSQKTFTTFLTVSLLTTLADIASVYVITRSAELPENVVIFFAKLYLIMLLGMMYCGLLYIISDIIVNTGKFRRVSISYTILLIPVAVAMAILPIYYTCEENGTVVYTYGPTAVTAYISFIVMFSLMVMHMISSRKQILPRKITAVSVWLGIWLISAALQYKYPNLLIVSFAGALGVLIIFTMVENPVLALDRQTPSTFWQ